MKSENSNIRRRKYLLAFTFVTALNIALGIFLLTISFGQSSEKSFKDQPPITAEVVTQNDSPLRIIINNVDNTAESHQTINFTIQNISSKKIKAYVLFHADESGAGRATTNLFHSFVPQQIIQNSIIEERFNIKSAEKIFLSFDYVEFDDGSFWGKNSLRQSEYISGNSEGQKSAIKQIKELFVNQNKDAISNLLQQQTAEIEPPTIDNKETSKWQRGFISGYRSALFQLKIAYTSNGLEAVSQKIEQLEKLTKMEEK